MPIKPPTGNTLKYAPRCPECGMKIRKVRTTKFCPGCKQTLPIERFGHHRNRPDHRGPYHDDCKRARDKHAIALKRSPKAGANSPTVLQPPFGQYNEIRGDTVTGTVVSIRRPIGWTEVERSGTLIVKELLPPQHNGAWVVALDVAYYEDGQGPDSELSVYVAVGDGRLWFYTDQDTYVEGQVAHVSFDADGVATQIERMALQDG